MQTHVIQATILVLLILEPRTSAAQSRGIDFFEKKIRPVLVKHCYECHSVTAKEPKGKLRLDSRDLIRKGGETGPAIVPGNVGKSLLLEAIRYQSLEMPPKQRLPDTVIADFVKWVQIGAPDPRDKPPTLQSANEQAWREIYVVRRKWWSLQPVVCPQPPRVTNRTWPIDTIDRFVLAKLEAHKLQPAPAADRQTLIRRLNFVLLGLPPTPDEVNAFLEDTAPDAYERLVDRVLASPHFGERWARHWMDVVRYSDTYGYEWDIPAKGAWRYRDYLTRAFNQDVPFDQLVREQIAGDLLEHPRIDPLEQINESMAGVMFYQLGEKRHGDSAEFNGIHQEMLDNKIDAFSKAFQATTIACARCHDHKLDPVAQSEYYALGGVFMSSRWVVNTLDTPQRHAELFGRLRGIKSKLRQSLARVWLKQLDRLADDLLATAEGTTKNTEHTKGGAGDAPSRSPRLQALRKLMTFQKGKPPTLEDARHAWFKLAHDAPANGKFADRWTALAKQYADEGKRRVAANARDFVVIADFRKDIPDGWSVDGVGVRDRIKCGDFTVALTGADAIDRVLPGGLFTNSMSPRMNGAARTPWLHGFNKPHISFESCGGDFSAHRTVFDNAFLTEKQVYLKGRDPSWISLSTHPSRKKHRIFIEFVTKTSNPNFPPRVGLGGKCTEEQAADPRSWFGLTRVVLHDKPGVPADELERFGELFDGEVPRSLTGVARRYQNWLRQAVLAWSRGRSKPEHVKLINWMIDNKLLDNQMDATSEPEVTKLVNQYRQLEKQLAEPQTTCGMADIDPGYNYRLNIRGDYDQLGDPVPRGYLQIIGESLHAGPAISSTSNNATAVPSGEYRVNHRFASPGSGRRELAEMVANPQNPLTARVFVNRVWYWLFGTGIVATPSDFGQLGDRPSHLELLDHLANRFMNGGWSVKKLIRAIVLTSTWRQSGRPDGQARIVDPKNRLLHHYPIRRLEAEAIRDAMLAVSDRLDARLYGRPINPHRQNEDPQKRLFSGPLDGNGRRSIYTKITIMEPPRLLATFNQPEPKIPTGKRDVTNTPTQSLTLLNDPFVIGQAEYCARRLIDMHHTNAAARLKSLFQTALGRQPTATEIKRWQAALRSIASLHNVAPAQHMKSIPVWKDMAHTMFNTKEFLYIQ